MAEAFGLAWAEAGDRRDSDRVVRAALGANDGSASIKAAEQLGNLRARLAWETADKAQAQGNAKARHAALDTARKQIEEALAALERIVAMQRSIERESLCGSAYKRLALVEAAAGNERAEMQAIARMAAHYRARRDARTRGSAPSICSTQRSTAWPPS